MNTLPTSAATNAPTRRWLTTSTAAAVPTSTGEIAAGRVRGRAAISHSLTGSGALWEPGEVGSPTLDVGVAPLLALLGHVEEEGRVVRELLQAGEPVLGGVEARLQEAQREGGEVRHLAAPGDGLALQLGERDHRVDQAHPERLPGVVEPAQEPDLLRPLDADVAGQKRGAEAAVEAAHARPGLPEASVVGGDRQVADQVEDVAAAHGVPGDHRHHG